MASRLATCPAQRFAVNATWLKLAILSYNIASAIKGLCFSPEERTARFKKYRLLLVHVAGRMPKSWAKSAPRGDAVYCFFNFRFRPPAGVFAPPNLILLGPIPGVAPLIFHFLIFRHIT